MAGRRNKKADVSISGAMNLDDLRWLVDQCANLHGTSSVTTKEYKSHAPTDWDEASITVHGDMP